MKRILLIAPVLLFIVINISCQKDEKETLQDQLIKKSVWSAVRFVVNGENTMPPENSDILDGPVAFVKIIFLSKTTLTLEMELIYDGGTKDNSGVLPMKWSLNSENTVISIVDNNLWTESAPFTGNHLITLTGNTLLIQGRLGEFADFEMELTGNNNVIIM
jgi:hypothetical protein